MSLKILAHSMFTVPKTNIRPDRDSNPEPPSFELQPDQTSHWGRSDYHQDISQRELGINQFQQETDRKSQSQLEHTSVMDATEQ